MSDRLLLKRLERIEQLLQEMQAESEKHYTVEQAAEYLGLSVHTLYSYCSKGILSHYKSGAGGKGAKVYFLKKDLDRYARAHRIESNNEMIAWATEGMR